MSARQRFVSSTLFVVTLFVSALAYSREQTIEAFFEDFSAQWVRLDPDLATATRYFSGTEQTRLERQLTPQTLAWRKRRLKLAQEGLRELGRFDATRLNDTQRLSADLMRWQLDMVVRGEAFADYWFPLEQFQGANVTLVDNLTVRHPLNTAEDADNYVARLQQLGTRMDEARKEAERVVKKGVLPPRFILQATIAQMRAFAGTAPEQSPLVTALSQRVGEDVLSGVPRERLLARATRIVNDDVYPAWTRAIRALEAQLPRATDDAGVWRYGEGAALYAYALNRYTTTSMSAEAVHELGLAQVARIEAQMDTILRQIGRTQGSVRERMKQLDADLQYRNPTSDESRAAIMRDIDGYLADALRRSESLFDVQPKTQVIARPFPRFREANAAANYNRAPLDGSRPAVFQMPLRPQRMTRLGLRTLVYHETVPGHHFQIALEQENESLPRFRKARALGGVAALSEGWALYAEKLVAESGWYEGDPEGLLGQLSGELWRARRLVVDTGLHAKRWTRQQAIDYGLEPSEIERYVVYPGQACAYMVGQLKLLELREQARAALGERFSLRDFHRVVLSAGTVPLDILAREVERYVALPRASSAAATQ